MGNQEIFLYYFILILGVLFVLVAIFIFIAMYSDKDYTILNVGKSLGIVITWCFIFSHYSPKPKIYGSKGI